MPKRWVDLNIIIQDGLTKSCKLAELKEIRMRNNKEEIRAFLRLHLYILTYYTLTGKVTEKFGPQYWLL